MMQIRISERKSLGYSKITKPSVIITSSTTDRFLSMLTNKQKDLCAYTGVFGALISATCFFQLMAISREHWLAFALLGVNLFSIVVFVLLALQKPIGPWLLIAVAGLLFLANVVYLFNGVYSLIVLLSLLYSVIVVVLLFVEQVPARLRAKALAEKAEALAWKDKI
jgi:hypothetical protein